MRFLLAAALSAILAGQAPPEFEVASIRPTPDQTAAVGGVQITQNQVRISGLSLKIYLSIAYRMQNWQIAGPAWLGNARFDIQAKLPDGASPQSVPDMLQTLLVQRFKVQTHREPRDAEVYALRIAKSGLVIKPVTQDAATPGVFTGTGTGGSNGVMVDLGRGTSYAFADNKFEGKKIAFGVLAQALSNFVGRPVYDMTDDHQVYDITLELTPEDFMALRIRAADSAGVVLPPEARRLLDSASMDSLFEALRKAGLSLESRRAPIDTLVIDQIEKTPTEN